MKKDARILSNGTNVEDVLKTWRSMDLFVREAEEEDLGLLLAHEMKTKKRRIFMTRIYGRFSKLRYNRETRNIRTVGDEN